MKARAGTDHNPRQSRGVHSRIGSAQQKGLLHDEENNAAEKNRINAALNKEWRKIAIIKTSLFSEIRNQTNKTQNQHQIKDNKTVGPQAG